MILALLAIICSALAGTIPVLELRGGVNPGSADYVVRGIQAAQAEEAPAVVLLLDTPGGLVTSARDIVSAQLASEVPIIVYVEPSGARAGSAGVFITMAGHVAAMAPGTTIGAAHPVSLFGAPGDVEDEDAEQQVIEQKILEDTLAWARAIAESRDRNIEWIEKAVRESAAITDREALELNVIDVVAPNIHEVLHQVDGWVVETAVGPVELRTAGVELRPVRMTVRQTVVHFLSDPNILFALVGLGLLGLYIEFQQPGLLLPGAVGVLCLLGASIGLAILPFNVAGLLLLLLGMGLLALEIFTPTVGALAAAGSVAIVLGGLLLFEVEGLDLRIHPSVLIAVGVASGVVAVGVAWLVASDRGAPIATGAEGLVGMQGQVRVGGEGSGWVRVAGEEWRGRWKGHLEAGDVVRVARVDGLVLEVERIEP